MNINSVKEYPYITESKHCSGDIIEYDNLELTCLILVTDGPLNCEINFKKVTVPTYSILIVDEKTSFKCEVKNATTIKVLQFNTAIFSTSIFFACGFINAQVKNSWPNGSILYFNDENVKSIEGKFQEIRQLVNASPIFDIDNLMKKVRDLLEEGGENNNLQDVIYVNDFALILHNQFNVCHSVSDYALQLKVTPKNLLRQFKKVGIDNPSFIIKNRILIESKLLLVYTDKTVSEICFNLGFSDPAYFSRFFKRNTGMTTRMFRKQFTNT